MPVGVPEPALGVTVTVKVFCWPNVVELFAEVSVSVVPVGEPDEMVTLNGVPLLSLPLKLPSPL